MPSKNGVAHLSERSAATCLLRHAHSAQPEATTSRRRPLSAQGSSVHHWRASWKQHKCTVCPLVLMPDSGRAKWNSDVLNILTYSCICYINNAPAALPNTRGAFFACLDGLAWVSVVAATPVCPNQRKWNSDVPGEYSSRIHACEPRSFSLVPALPGGRSSIKPAITAPTLTCSSGAMA